MVIISPAHMEEFESGAVADTGTVKGKIVDENGKPLRGVTISLKNSTHTVLSDENGNFAIEASSSAVLQISYVGYKEQAFAVGGQKVFSVQLQPNATGLNEVVVVGYRNAEET